MKYQYDVLVIGLGPAGMAVSVMASEMGLRVAAVEAHKVGGECMNVGCIPSKALLRMGKHRHAISKLESYQLSSLPLPQVLSPFSSIQKDLSFINEKKTMSMFSKVDLRLEKGKASFVDAHTVKVGQELLTANKIFVCVGTKPEIPNVTGLKDVNPLTNETLFNQDSIPETLAVLGGGAIACEMAQAFLRLGSKVTMIIRGERLLRKEDPMAVEVVESSLLAEGVEILRETKVEQASLNDEGKTVLKLSDGTERAFDKVLAALGRSMDFSALSLENAGVQYSNKGIVVNDYLQTTASNVFAVGDCNGYFQFSHAAMHQGMCALMNSILPRFSRVKFKNYVVPWTIFTEPQVSHVGTRASELREKGIKFEEVVVKYGDYGAAIAEKVDVGFVKVLTNSWGRIFGVTIVGEGSGEMINEWALAIQQNIRMHKIMFLQHSFPSMSFLNKRAAETWMMNRMKSGWLRAMARLMFRF